MEPSEIQSAGINPQNPNTRDSNNPNLEGIIKRLSARLLRRSKPTIAESSETSGETDAQPTTGTSLIPVSDRLTLVDPGSPLKPDIAEAIGKHNIYFDHPPQDYDQWQAEHPDTRILTAEESEVITPEDIPSIAGMDHINPNEDVHLTEASVWKRIEVFLHTHPQFAEVNSLSVEDIKDHPMAPISTQSNIRQPVEAQTAIRILEDLGFTFIRRDGQIAMLVDSVIPAKDNTDGRIHQVPLGVHRDPRFHDNLAGTPYVELGVSGMIPSHPGRLGFRQTTDKTKKCFALPVSEVLDLHIKHPGIEYGYAGLSQADEDLQPNLTADHASSRIIGIITRSFNRLRKEAVNNKELEALFRFAGSPEIHLEAKRLLYGILCDQVGLRPGSSAYSFFPKEPVFAFVYDDYTQLDRILDRDDSQFDKNTLGELTTGSGKHMVRHFYLEDILGILQSRRPPSKRTD